MPPESSAGYFAGGIGRQTHHAEPHRGDLVQQLLRQIGMLSHRRLHVLRDGLVAEQGAVLEQDTAADLHLHQMRRRQLREVVAQHFDAATPPGAAVR